MDLKGKVVLIAGAGTGYGKAYCTELFKQGCKLCICDINLEEGAEIISLLGKPPKDRVIYCPLDVTDYLQFEEAFQETISKLGGLDIIVNNAAVMNDRLWELAVDVNLNGIIRGLLLAFRFLGRDRGGPGGIVVNCGSSCSEQPILAMPVYTATKHAVAALTRCYGDQYHLKLTGVKVLNFCPPPPAAALEVDPRKRIFSTEYEQAWDADIKKVTTVSPEVVAKNLIEVIQKAPSGTSWLVKKGKPQELTVFP